MRRPHPLCLPLVRGNPQLLAGRRIKLVGFNVDLDGVWTISSVEHRIDAAGYITSLPRTLPESTKLIADTSAKAMVR